MKKFIVVDGNVEGNYHIALYNKRHQPLITHSMLKDNYDISLELFKKLSELYNFTSGNHSWVTLLFLKIEDAEKFIDEVLIPHEIAYNLNGE